MELDASSSGQAGGFAVPQPPSPPSADTANLMRCLLELSQDVDPVRALTAQAQLLDALFVDMVLNNRVMKCEDSLSAEYALRLQRQCRQTIEALSTLARLRQPLAGG